MSRNETILWVAGTIILLIALTITGCSDGGNSSPTAPPDPIANANANSSSGSSGSSGDTEQFAFASVDIENRINGVDADFPPGLTVPPDSDVTWIYTITNNGDEALTITGVVDDLAPDVLGCPTELAPAGSPGASGECTSITQNVGAAPLEFTNVATVMAETSAGEPVSDSDASNYTLGDTETFIVIDVQKLTNDEDADSPTGPILLAADDPGPETVTWTYAVTNLSDVAVDITMAEDTLDGGSTTQITCLNGPLARDATIECSSAEVPAELGQHSNLLTVEATYDDEPPVTASDRSHYFGADPGITLLKKTDNREMPTLIPGCPVTWTYDISNIGNVELESIELLDDMEGAIACPSTTLNSLDSMTCTHIGTVGEENYQNEATVTGLYRIARPDQPNEVSAIDDDGYTIDFGPICDHQIVPSVTELWPPNHRLEEVELFNGVCDDATHDIVITGVTQDEPVNGLGDGDTSPDAFFDVSSSSVELRRERAGGGNGRVYAIAFMVGDVEGGAGCSGTVNVSVPHDQSGSSAVDDGQEYDSTVE